MSSVGRTRTIILLLATAAFAGARPVGAQNLHYGVNAHVVSQDVVDKTTELGAGVIRVAFGWDTIEPSCKGCFDWTTTDGWRDQARRTHRAIVGSLGYAPRWANGGHTYNYPPLNQQDWYDFVYAVVSRYKDDIFLWGVWNEPNLDSYLRNGDLAAYEKLVVTAHAAIRAANPDALVLGPDVSHHAIPNGWFVQVMKAVGHLFDIVTVHWYADGMPLERMMDDVVRPNSQFKSVWLTEVGQQPCHSALGEAGQAMFFQHVLRAFEARRDWWTGLVIYDIYDAPSPLDCGSGITRYDWTNRPAFVLLQKFIRADP